MPGMTCPHGGKFFLLDFAKTSSGYEPRGFPLQLSEASHILKMVLAGESRPSSEGLVFLEDSVLMQTIANIVTFATKSYAYVKSYNDAQHKSYHAIVQVVGTDGPHACTSSTVPSPNSTQTLCAHNPQGPIRTYPEDPSNEYIKDLRAACDSYNLHIMLLNTDVFNELAFNSRFFDQPASMMNFPCQESNNTQPTMQPTPSTGPSESQHETGNVGAHSPDDLGAANILSFNSFINQESFSEPQSDQNLIKSQNNEMTVTLREILLHTPPVQSPKDNDSPHSLNEYATCTEGGAD